MERMERLEHSNVRQCSQFLGTKAAPRQNLTKRSREVVEKRELRKIRLTFSAALLKSNGLAH
jgi:hypothetical protein